MNPLGLTDITRYVEENIGTFHQKRIDSLDNLKLKTVLKRKNPYLFKAKHVLTAEQIIKGLTDAFISSNEETIFGDWLEGLAIFINQKVYGGWKSGITGIDLEFDKDNIRFIVTIKSGPSWGNSSQIAKMKADFSTAAKTLRTSNSGLIILPVNGCCYGKDNHLDKGGYFKFCGQEFWKFISGNENLYIDIIEPLGHKAREQHDHFIELYARTINKFTRQFINEFCFDNGQIDWAKLVEFNSRSYK
ncbi:MAG: cytosolic protein [Cytophagales bacterium]|nr:cytosolic protein [Cytophagales bacterium]